MALSQVYTLSNKRLRSFFEQLKSAQAPDKLNVEVLKDWGFSSSNDRAFIPILKALGFLTGDGVPTQRYHEFRGGHDSAKLLGQGMRDAYGDLFVIKERPTKSDKPLILSKFKSAFNANDLLAERLTETFFSLLELADISSERTPTKERIAEVDIKGPHQPANIRHASETNLHYNIQIHLPPTKDIEVYSAIFKALREHLISE